MRSRNLVLSVILAVIFLNLITTVALACDPRVQYCPNVPSYQPPSAGGWNRVQYDVNYAVGVTGQAYNQVAWIGGKVWDSAQSYPYASW